MAFPRQQFQQHYQPHHQQQEEQQQSKSFRNLYAIETQISPPIAYYHTPNLQDSSQHLPYIPPFHVAGFALGPIPVADESDAGAEMQWNNEGEPKRKKLKEQDFLENNSQISSVDFLQARSVSTGLGLSLDNNNNRMASSGDSALLSLIGDDIDNELQRQDAEIDRFLKVQGDRLRQSVLEKVQVNQLQTISLVEERVFQKLREKEAEVENINKKNMELEGRMEQLTMEASAWQQRARYNENMITALKFNLQQVYAQSRDSKEGCGDSEVDDTASCCNGRAIDFHLLCKENSNKKELMTCKACAVNEACMLLLPCRHLCLCKSCESKLSFCPICQSSKFIGTEVFM
ncbi:heat stress transcription factor B-4-like [Hibiscus syriacus]|uniref:Heat stress transcription factor B-4-like n=1 Tax=Hibiscus syriacus TaxID=106335 RepID=A0A6A3CFI0_HIBSY|nr:probable BOI-related E3 ubiquitin-protein ligase 2 [Hibiscus syriacus]KAE8727983.1 heat stress transcription factor B-4-like [Hibiscus syriacus]